MFYDRFVAICKERGVSPSKVAIHCGFNKSSVTNWKKNGYAPRQEILTKIANYFGVSIDYLLGNEQKENPPAVDGEGKDKLVTVFNMEGTPGAHTVSFNAEKVQELHELMDAARELSVEQIQALKQIIENFKK